MKQEVCDLIKLLSINEKAINSTLIGTSNAKLYADTWQASNCVSCQHFKTLQ